MVSCSGPCLEHCQRCGPVATALAYAALGYLIASVVYLLLTKLGMRTPFLDSLTPEQRSILDRSKRQRRGAFLAGVLVAAAVLVAARPFLSRRSLVGTRARIVNEHRTTTT